MAGSPARDRWDVPSPSLPRRVTRPQPGQRVIALFTDDFYPQSGGVARSIELQVRELVRGGDHVTLFAPRTRFDPPEVGDYVTLPTLRVPNSPSHMCSVQFDGVLARRIARMRSFDVLHSQNERGSLLLAAGVARLLGAPHVHTFHSNYAGIHDSSPLAGALCSTLFLPNVPRLLAAAAHRRPAVLASRAPAAPSAAAVSERRAAGDWRHLARIAALTDAFTAPAPFVIDAIVDASGGALAGRGSAVASGVSDRFLAARRRRPRGGVTRFLSAGRLGAEKRVDAVITAFALLGRDDAELIIVGEGDEGERLRKLAERVEHGTIQFAGHIGDVGRLAAEYADADVFVLASHRFDTQGMVLAEAAASGTAILYCDDRLTVGVTPANALLTGPSPEELAAGMRRLMDDPAAVHAMAAASKELGQSLSPAQMTQGYLAVYDAARARLSR